MAEVTPEQLVRAESERDPSPRYADGRPKMHRHFAEYAVHSDEGCTRPSSRIRVYVFDEDNLLEHERFIAERAVAEDRNVWVRLARARGSVRRGAVQ